MLPLIKRTLYFIALLWLCMTLVFSALVLMHGNPVSLYLDPRLDEAQRERLAQQYGYDQKPWQQYQNYCLNLMRGDLGVSFLMKRPVSEILPRRMLASFILGSAALVLALALSTLLLLGLHHPHWRACAPYCDALLAFCLSLPPFVMASLAMGLLAVRWRFFPVAGSHALFTDHMSTWQRLLDASYHLVLPALSLAVPLAAQVSAYLHERLRQMDNAPFVISAMGRGLSPVRVFWNHKVRVLLPSLAQIAGLYLPALAAGTLVIESIFGWSGMGLLFLDAAQGRDFPLLLGGSALTITFTLLGYQIADALREQLARKGYGL